MLHPTRLKKDAHPLVCVQKVSRQGVGVPCGFYQAKHHLKPQKKSDEETETSGAKDTGWPAVVSYKRKRATCDEIVIPAVSNNIGSFSQSIMSLTYEKTHMK